jgi:hypothetical protein
VNFTFNWQDAMNAVAIRTRVRDALLAPAMKNYYELAGAGAAAPDIADIVQARRAAERVFIAGAWTRVTLD